MTVRALAHPRVRVRVRSPRPVSAFHGVFRCDAAAPSSTIPLPRAPSPTTPRTSRQTFRSPSRTPPHRFARTARRSRRRRRFFSPAPRTARTPPPPPRLPRVRTPARASPRVSQRPRRRPRIDRLASRRVRSRARRLGFAARRSACPATSSSSTAGIVAAGGIAVAKDSFFGGTLGVTGATSLAAVSASGTLSVAGATTLASDVTLSGTSSLSVAQDLTVSGVTTLTGAVTATGGLSTTTASIATASGDITTATGSIAVTGATGTMSCAGTMAVDGDVTFAGVLHVTDTSDATAATATATASPHHHRPGHQLRRGLPRQFTMMASRRGRRRSLPPALCLLFLPARAALPIPTAAPTWCEDAASWHKKGSPAKDCAWVAGVATRCAVVGEDGSTASAACAACAAPPAAPGAWHKKGDPAKDCAWALKNAARCAAVGEDGALSVLLHAHLRPQQRPHRAPCALRW